MGTCPTGKPSYATATEAHRATERDPRTMIARKYGAMLDDYELSHLTIDVYPCGACRGFHLSAPQQPEVGQTAADVVIPARNAAGTVAAVVLAFNTALTASVVIVVDDGSTDGTDAAAEAAGASVIYGPRQGKGQAMVAGMTAVTTERVIFCDANLKGFTPTHAALLAADFNGMILGAVPHLVPETTGQRSLPTWLARNVDLRGYAAEEQLNLLARARALPIQTVWLDGVWKPKYGRVPSTTMAANRQRSIEAGADMMSWLADLGFPQ